MEKVIFMVKYLYIYNYSPHEKDLCELEFRILFSRPMTSKYYLTDQYFDYTRSVYIKGRLDILKLSTCFDDIIDFIQQADLCYYNFKVIYLKNEITHVHYKEAIEKCKKVAFPIAGSVNMQHPDTIFAITKIDETWYFGIYHDERKWAQRYEKPHSYSHSLNTRDARTLVNLAVGHDLKKRIVDPCCGIGTVVLEALSMGIDIEGYDMNRDVSYRARLNLEHFGYDPLLIQKRDMRTLETTYDVTIMDIPYGVYSPFTLEQQLELLRGARRLSLKLVLVSHIQMNEYLVDLGYRIIDQAKIKKGSFLRYITLGEIEGGK